MSLNELSHQEFSRSFSNSRENPLVVLRMQAKSQGENSEMLVLASCKSSDYFTGLLRHYSNYLSDMPSVI